MRLILIAALLLMAQPALAQVKIISEPRKPTRQPTYMDAAQRAVRAGKPFVVFVDCYSVYPSEPGAVVYHCGAGEWWDLTGTLARGVAVSIPVGDWLSSGADWLPANSTWEQIQAEISRVSTPKEVRRSPSPFYPSLRYRNALLYGEPTADDEPKAAGPWPKGMPFISGLRHYQPTQVTQKSGNRTGSGVNWVVHRSSLPSKWHQPGGLEGVTGWKSDLYKLDGGTRNWFGPSTSEVLAPLTHQRAYGDGTLFVDVLSNADTGEVFELRAREKADGRWHNYIAYRDRKARPRGYSGLRGQTCVECHSEAGTGGYATVMIPGGDETLSDPLPIEKQ